MSKSLADLQCNRTVLPLTREAAQAVIAQARTGAVGIPRLIRTSMENGSLHDRKDSGEEGGTDILPAGEPDGYDTVGGKADV